METVNASAIERLRESRREFLEARAAEGNRLVQAISMPCDPPVDEDADADFDEAMDFGASWAKTEATYEQLRALEHLATLIGMDAAPWLDRTDPARSLIEMLADEDEEVDFEQEEYGRLKQDWFGVVGGGVSTRRGVEGWIAGALEFWRSIKVFV